MVSTLLKVKESLSLVKILVSDLREAPGTFSLLEDQSGVGLVSTCRIIDYATLYNEKTGEKVPLSALTDSKLHERYSKQLTNLYYLKYRINDLQTLSQASLPSLIPHLESDVNPRDHEIEGITTVNRETYGPALKQAECSVIEVYAKKCPGCKTVEPLLPQI